MVEKLNNEMTAEVYADGIYGDTTLEGDGVEIRVENEIVIVLDNGGSYWEIGLATEENMQLAYAELDRLLEEFNK